MGGHGDGLGPEMNPTIEILHVQGSEPQTCGWFLAGNEGMRPLDNSLKGTCRALIPSFPTQNRGVLLGVHSVRSRGLGTGPCTKNAVNSSKS